MHPAFFNSVQAPAVSAPPVPPDYDFSIPINAHGQSTDLPSTSTDTPASSTVPSDPSIYHDPPSKGSCSNSVTHQAGPSKTPAEYIQNENNSTVPSAPMAPQLPNDSVASGPVHYPLIDSTPIDLSATGDEILLSEVNEKKQKEESCCVICLDAPVEGACIPCGHMAGCMMCLNEIKMKNWGCPVCRATIDQVVRLYAV